MLAFLKCGLSILPEIFKGFRLDFNLLNNQNCQNLAMFFISPVILKVRKGRPHFGNAVQGPGLGVFCYHYIYNYTSKIRFTNKMPQITSKF